MDFLLTDEQRQIRDSIARICAEFGEDYWYHKDLNHEFPHEFSRAFAEAGWFGAIFPEEIGGAGLGITEAAIIMSEVGRNGFNACSTLHMNMFGCQPIVKFGNKEQQRRFLPPIIAGTDRACFGVTEPDAGLDTTHIRTFAERRGDHYVVNGRKVWTSTAQVANKILLLTRTSRFEDSPKPSAGMTLFYTDLDRRKVEVRQIEKCGRNAVDSNALFIDGLEIPEEDRIGEEGRGFQYLLHGLNSERIIVAAGILGASRYVRPADRDEPVDPASVGGAVDPAAGGRTDAVQGGDAVRQRGGMRAGGERGEIPVRGGILQVGVARGAHAWRHGLCEGVPCRAVFPRVDPAVGRAGEPGTGAVLRGRTRAGAAEIVLTMRWIGLTMRWICARRLLGRGCIAPIPVLPNGCRIATRSFA